MNMLNTSNKDVTLPKGHKVAQMIVKKFEFCDIVHPHTNFAIASYFASKYFENLFCRKLLFWQLYLVEKANNGKVSVRIKKHD